MSPELKKPNTSATDPPKPPAKLAPVKKKIGETGKNLEQRRAWFERRAGKDEAPR